MNVRVQIGQKILRVRKFSRQRLGPKSRGQDAGESHLAGNYQLSGSQSPFLGWFKGQSVIDSPLVIPASYIVSNRS